MILDIDIRVSSENGVQIHQFTKHFDSRFEGNKIEGGNDSLSRNFEDFLSEFLSGSGKVIRNQLITSDSKETANTFEPANTTLQNIEYTLKLGDSQFVSGRIPLDKLIHLSEISQLSKTTNDIPSVSEAFSQSELILTDHEENSDHNLSNFSNESLIFKRTPFKNSIDLEEVDKMFQQIINNAVDRYETSFYINNQENINFTKSS